MKRIFSLILVCMMTFSLAGCSAGESRAAESGAVSESSTAADTLIIYFSCTGNTKAAAEEIQRQTGADMFEIVPEIPYTAEDLNYNDDNSRANQEQSDDSARPAIREAEPEASVLDGLRVGDTSDIAGWLEEVLP